jgi:hypothetical protein
LSNELPNYTVLDLESARLTSRSADPAKTPISVLCAWGLRDLSPRLWILDAARFPRVYLAEDDAATYFSKYDGIVGWNSLRFDVPCMKGQINSVYKAFAKKRHVDLHANCCLLSAGVEESRLVAGLDENWGRLTPVLRADLLNAGWSLEAVATGTLGVGKTDGFNGLEAVDAWNNGLYSPTISYNIGDVAQQRELFIHAWREGVLISSERGRVSIPQSVL